MSVPVSPSARTEPFVLPMFSQTRVLQIAVATSGFCNARCSSCIWPFMVGPDGVMKLDEFRTMLDNLDGYEFSEFAFNVINEPFTDRGVSDKLRELARRQLRIQNVFFSSNWLLPSPAQIEDFADAIAECHAAPSIKTIALNATVSGIDDASYDVLQSGSELEGTIRPYRRQNFDRAVSNITAVLKALAARDLSTSLVFHIKAYGNLFSQEQMEAFWGRILREHEVPEAFVQRSVRVMLNHSFISFARADESASAATTRRCRGRWMSEKFVVGPRGEVGLCCQDGLRDVRMDSLLQHDLSTVVESDEFQRQLRIAGGHEQPEANHPCLRCEFYVP